MTKRNQQIFKILRDVCFAFGDTHFKSSKLILSDPTALRFLHYERASFSSLVSTLSTAYYGFILSQLSSASNCEETVHSSE